MPTLAKLTRQIQQHEATLRQGGGASGQDRQRRLGRMTVRERLNELFDSGTPF